MLTATALTGWLAWADHLLVAAAVIGGSTIVIGAATLRLHAGVRSAQTEALRDALTGLPNRTLLDDRIEQALVRARRTGESFAVLVVDLDGFKEVNDIRGHEAGNQVLRNIARRLESVVRTSDTVARIGGDEFVVISLGTGENDEAAALVGRIRHALRRPYRVEGGVVELDASIGWSLFPANGATPTELLGWADGQMFATKRDGAEGSAGDRRQSLDAGIVQEFEFAIERHEVVVHYQPILDLRSGAVTSVEALVRRAHPNRGLVSPAEFIPHVERTPLIRALTLHVVADALTQARVWENIGHTLGVSVNVPYRALDDPELVEGIGVLLRSTGTAGERLTLDVIPSGPGAGAELDRVVLDGIGRLGVRISLDDFGRASSLAALRVLPLAQVKIDSSFVQGAGHGGPDDAIVRGLAELAHTLGLDVVAEGVENRRVWDAAAALGCDYAQGFYVETALPADGLTHWLDCSWPAIALAAS